VGTGKIEIILTIYLAAKTYLQDATIE